MRLIDADTLRERLQILAYDDWNQGITTSFSDACHEIIDIIEEQPTIEPEIEVVRCKDCRWGREVCGNIECFVDSDIFTEYHAYEWFCPNGERRQDATS